MVKTQGELIDKCADYIESRGAAYIAMTGEVVFQHEGQCSWHKQSIAQTLRIIKATMLDPSSYDLLQERHLVAAFQELAKVFESATDTMGDTPSGVFNYRDEGRINFGVFLLNEFVAALTRDYLCLSYTQVYESYRKLATSLGEEPYPDAELGLEMYANDWQKRCGTTRIQVGGKKITAWMRTGAKPSDIQTISKSYHQLLTARIKDKMK